MLAWYRQNRDFAKLLAGQLVSETGGRITRDGVPMIAALLLGATARDMGFLVAASYLPSVATGLFAGVLVDRVPKRRILIATDLIRALLVLSIPVAALAHRLSLAQLYAVTALAGILALLFEVAEQAYIPALVPKESLVAANAQRGAIAAGAEIGGPALGGFLIQALTAPVAMAVDACSYLVSAASLIAIRARELPAAPPRGQKLWQQAMQGVVLFMGQPRLRWLLVGSLGGRLFGGFVEAAYILFVLRVLRFSPSALGLLIAAGGVGGLLGAGLASRLRGGRSLGTSLLLTFWVGGFTSFFTPLAHGSGPLAFGLLLAGQLLGDSAMTANAIYQTTVIQLDSPPEAMGRVGSARQTLLGLVGPLGALLGGVVGSVWSPRLALYAAAAGKLLVALCLSIARPKAEWDRG